MRKTFEIDNHDSDDDKLRVVKTTLRRLDQTDLRSVRGGNEPDDDTGDPGQSTCHCGN